MESLYNYIEQENIEHEVLKIDSDDGIMLIKKPSFIVCFTAIKNLPVWIIFIAVT